MKNWILIIVFFKLMTQTILVQGQNSHIDNFEIKNNKVEVYFYDPLLVLSKDENVSSKSDDEKINILDEYLHNHALYLFVVTNSKKKDITYFCIRGNPEKLRTKYFYQVEVIKGSISKSFDPNTNIYSDKILKVIDKVNCGGFLFESSDIFSKPENKDKVGNGIQFYGIYCRVQPYSEIKNSMIDIIEQEVQ